MKRVLRVFATAAAATLIAAIGGGGVLQPTAAAADPVSCKAGTAGDVDGNGVGDVLVEAQNIYKMTEFELIRHPSQQRQVIGAKDLDPNLERSVSLSAAALGDLDGDGCADAVFGGQLRPTGEASFGTKARLYVVPGSPDGLRFDRAVRINLDSDAISRIALLPATRQIAATTRSSSRGALHVITLDRALTTLTHKVVKSSELGRQGHSQFGYALAADATTIAVGSPVEVIDHTGVRGAVYLFSAKTMKYTRIHQRSKGVYTRVLSRFGHSVDLLGGRLVVGAPSTDVGNQSFAGRVYLLRWNEAKRTFSAVRTFTQATKGVPGIARYEDAFGSSVAFARGLTRSASYDVVVAALYDQVGKMKYAGSLTVTNFDKGGYRLITQSSPGVPGSPKAHARFGSSIGVRSDSARTSALLVSACGFDRPDSDDCGVLQARSTRLDSWSSLWPSTTGFVHWGGSIVG